MLAFVFKNSCKIFLLDRVIERCKWKIFYEIVNTHSNQKDSDQKAKCDNACVPEFSDVFGDYFDKIYKFFYFKLRSQQDAEDLAAETFEKVFKNLSSFEDRGFGVQAWVFRIATNILNDFYRKSKLKIDSIDELQPSKEPSEDFDFKSLDRKILKDELWEVIQTLPRRHQDLWAFKLVNDFSHKEIANLMDTTEANVNVLLHRSIKTLKQRLSHLKDKEL